MTTDDLPEGPKAIETTRFTASRKEDLKPFLDRMVDQQVRFADISHRPQEKAVDILFERVFPPDRGTWALRIAGVRSWQAEHQANHETDTFEDLRIAVEDQGAKVVIRCVLDQFTAVVDRVDLRLVRLGADPPAKVQYRDLPEWFRREVQEKHNEALREEQRIHAVGTKIRLRAAAAGTALPFVLGLITGGQWFFLLLACALLGGGIAWILAGSRSSYLPRGIVYGLAATAACFAAGAWEGLFFTPLILVTLGVVTMIWVDQMRDMEV